mgnify:CR=1 FL=1
MAYHVGTHVDAMRHFEKGGKTIDQFSLNSLVGVAKIINLGALEPGSVIELHHLAEHFSEKHGKVVLRTDWSRFWNTKQYYKDWPYLTKEATEFLIQQGIHLLALDFPSPDSAYFGDDCSLDSPNHKLLFAQKIILTEYLTNLASLTSDNIFLMVSPLKLIGFDGAPARVTAYSIDK